MLGLCLALKNLFSDSQKLACDFNDGSLCSYSQGTKNQFYWTMQEIKLIIATNGSSTATDTSVQTGNTSDMPNLAKASFIAM